MDYDEKTKEFIADAVCRGVTKAIGIYLLVSFAVGVVLWVIRVIIMNTSS